MQNIYMHNVYVHTNENCDYYLNDNEEYEYQYAKVNSAVLTPAIPISLLNALVLEINHE